jgi:hypothetical protein
MAPKDGYARSGSQSRASSPLVGLTSARAAGRPFKGAFLGLSSLNEGAKVSFEVVQNRGKESAENLRVNERRHMIFSR